MIKNSRADRFGTVIMQAFTVLLMCICGALAASGQATSKTLVIKALAEVETKSEQNGREIVRLTAADRVVPGDQVVYTLEIRNAGARAVPAPIVIHPVPAHMAYLADSASGPGAELSFSVDGGRSFDRPENLRMIDENRQLRRAKASDYTHICWKLKNSLKSNSVAFAHFRAVVK